MTLAFSSLFESRHPRPDLIIRWGMASWLHRWAEHKVINDALFVSPLHCPVAIDQPISQGGTDRFNRVDR